MMSGSVSRSASIRPTIAGRVSPGTSFLRTRNRSDRHAVDLGSKVRPGLPATLVVEVAREHADVVARRAESSGGLPDARLHPSGGVEPEGDLDDPQRPSTSR